MEIRKNVSLEELGWKFYYDKDGKIPIAPNEIASLRPGETFKLYFRNRPTQGEDGRFYGTAVQATKKFPYFLFGFFRKEPKRNIMYIFGVEDQNVALHGRIESFALWDRALSDSDMLLYQNDKQILIGDTQNSFYADNETAENDGLVLFYTFNEHNSVLQNYIQNDQPPAVKNRNMDLIGGQTSNASEINRIDDFIVVDGASLNSDFSMNFRFFFEENKDFTLFSSTNIGIIQYDSSIGEFYVELRPHIGNNRIFNIQVPNIDIHRWYDFGITFEAGVVKIFLEEILDEFTTGLSIGGVESIILDHSNIESITATSNEMFEHYSIYNDSASASRMYDFAGQAQGTHITKYDSSKKELWNMLLGENRDFNAVSIGGDGYMRTYTEVLDHSSDDYAFLIQHQIYELWYHLDNSRSHIASYQDGTDSVEIGTLSNRFGAKGNSDYNTMSKTSNCGQLSALTPNGLVEITITTKATFESTHDVFPMVFTLPELPLGIKKIYQDRNDFNWVSHPSKIVDFYFQKNYRSGNIYNFDNLHQKYIGHSNYYNEHIHVCIPKNHILKTSDASTQIYYLGNTADKSSTRIDVKIKDGDETYSWYNTGYYSYIHYWFYIDKSIPLG